MHRTTIAMAFCSSLALACGSGTSGTTGTGSGTTTGGTSGNTVTINAYTFSAANLTVAAGSTISFVNNDTVAHTATSEAAAGNFTNAAAAGGFSFDTGQISAGATATVTVPTGLASGTVQPYYCSNHKSMMAPANPTLTIR
jgi:plastocyanin